MITAETLFAHALLRIGHKGLFFDRLDLGIVDGMTLEETPRLAVGADLLGYARNRVYSPRLGRWVQRDPNASGATVLGLAHSADSVSIDRAAFDLLDSCRNGSNLHEYLGSRPSGLTDPRGLSWDTFDLVDDFVAENEGSRAVFMQELSRGFDATMHIALQVAQMHPAIGLAVAAYQVANGAPITADILLNLIPGGKGANAIGRAFGSYSKGRHAMRGARAVGDDILELHHVVPQFMLGWKSSGRVVTLNRAQHLKYHKILDRILKDRGMPISNQGERAWQQWLAKNPGGGDDVRAALFESVDEFREREGVDMMADLWTEMTRQRWMLGN